jgi:hypothetical protein
MAGAQVAAFWLAMLSQKLTLIYKLMIVISFFVSLYCLFVILTDAPIIAPPLVRNDSPQKLEKQPNTNPKASDHATLSKNSLEDNLKILVHLITDITYTCKDNRHFGGKEAGSEGEKIYCYYYNSIL